MPSFRDDEEYEEDPVSLRIEEMLNGFVEQGGNADEMTGHLLKEIFGPYPCYKSWATDNSPLPQMVVRHQHPEGFDEMMDFIAEARKANSIRSCVTAPLDFSNIIPGYQPMTEIILLKEKTIMRVVETVDLDESSGTRGAPMDSESLYIWDGGMDFYAANPGKQDAFSDLITNERKITFNAGHGMAPGI